jgi:malonyl-CoA O-methyltransferase
MQFSDFSRACDSYDANAQVQQEMAELLLEQLHSHRPELSGTTLDLGAGTGYLSKLFSDTFTNSVIFPSDISFDSILKLHQDSSITTSIVNDFSKIPLRDSSVQNCISNAALQWSENLEKTFDEIKRVTKPQGYFAFTLFDLEHFKQFEQSANQTGFTLNNLIKKYSIQQIKDYVLDQGWKVLSIKSHTQTVHFKTLVDMLRHFRATGVRGQSSEKFPIKGFSKNWPKEKENRAFDLDWCWHSWVVQF